MYRACTPEELDALLEDAFVTSEAEALSGMFAEGSALAIGEGPDTARGLWPSALRRRAPPGGAGRDTVLVLADGAINVLRRGSDGAGRYAIALLSLDPTPTREQP